MLIFVTYLRITIKHHNPKTGRKNPEPCSGETTKELLDKWFGKKIYLI